MADYVVDAQLNLRTQQAMQGVSGLLGRLTSVTQNLTRIGAGYLGFRAIAGAVGVASRLITGFNSEVEGTRISLASVFSATEHVSFNQAMQQSEGIFRTLRDDAVRSTATTQELFGIYQSILGPIRGAGAGLEDVRNITLGTVNAATALGVDLGQAQRDIAMMATGTAGVDVKLFRMLRATGAIAEDATTFNQLTSAERVGRIQSALGRFAGAADAYSRSWAGVTSTFQDIVQQLVGAFSGPIFNRLKTFLGTINDKLLANRDRLEASLTAIGQRVAGILQTVFDRAIVAFDFVMAHWDEIVARITRAVDTIKTLVPQLAKTAAAFGVVRAGVGVAQGVSGIASIASGVAGAAGGGSATAAATSAVSAFISALAPMATVLVPLVGLIDYLVEEWTILQPVLLDTFGPLIAAFRDMGPTMLSLAQALRPVLKLVGFLTFLWISLFLPAIKAIGTVFKFVVDHIRDHVIPAIRMITDGLSDLIHRLTMGIFGRANAGPGAQTPLAQAAEAATTPETAADVIAAAATTPACRNSTTNNFNGPINVRQEFREADPDRVAFQMIDDIARAAENRLTSGFAPPLTR